MSELSSSAWQTNSKVWITVELGGYRHNEQIILQKYSKISTSGTLALRVKKLWLIASLSHWLIVNVGLSSSLILHVLLPVSPLGSSGWRDHIPGTGCNLWAGWVEAGNAWTLGPWDAVGPDSYGSSDDRDAEDSERSLWGGMMIMMMIDTVRYELVSYRLLSRPSSSTIWVTYLGSSNYSQ